MSLRAHLIVSLALATASGDPHIGTLTNDGGGRYRGGSTWSTNPQSIIVRSSRGGMASRTVTVK